MRRAACWSWGLASLFVLVSMGCADRARAPASTAPAPAPVAVAPQVPSAPEGEAVKPPPVPAAPLAVPEPPSAARIVRVSSVDFPVEAAVESAGRLLLMSPDGRVQIRGGDGRLEHSLDAGLTPLRTAAPVAEGWIAIGSSRQDVDGNEAGAAVLVRFDGSMGPLWSAPGVLTSVVSNGAAVVTTDVTGGAYTLRGDGSFVPADLPAEVRGAPARPVFWGDALAFCREGMRRPGKDPRGVCVSATGDRIVDVWKVPPIACGPYLVANVQANGMLTSPWKRIVWSAARGKLEKVAEKDLPGSPPAPSCFRTWLADTEGPGQLLELPSASVVRAPLCERASETVVAGREAIWCLQLAAR